MTHKPLTILFLAVVLSLSAKAQKQPGCCDGALTLGAGGIGMFMGDPTNGGVMASAGYEVVFPRWWSGIEPRVSYAQIYFSELVRYVPGVWPLEISDDYEVALFSYGLAYKFMYPLIEGEDKAYIVLDNEFSFANLTAKTWSTNLDNLNTENERTATVKNRFFYTARLGADFKVDNFIRVMPWVGISTLKLTRAVNHHENVFGTQEAPFTFGLTLKLW